MRLFAIALPTAIVLAVAGAALMIEARTPQQNYGINFGEPRHYITPQLELEAKAMANRQVPDERVLTDSGAKAEIGRPGADHPQFVLFIKDGCPCSIDAQPIFNSLARRYQGKIDFYGVIDAAPEKAKQYGSQYLVSFPVVADNDESIIKAYNATGGLFSALVARNGHIVKMWPGYSVDILAAMNHLLATEAGVKETPFDPQYAPTKTAGCAYGW